MEDLTSDAGLITCAYDVSHMIRVRRMPFHLEKCAKQHPDVCITSCQFNVVHRFASAAAAEAHERICPDRPRTPKNNEEQLPTGVLPVPVEALKYCDPSEECWDDHVGAKSTLQVVKESVKDKNVYLMQNVSGSKSEKKLRKMEERRRFNRTKEAEELERKAKEEWIAKTAQLRIKETTEK